MHEPTIGCSPLLIIALNTAYGTKHACDLGRMDSCTETSMSNFSTENFIFNTTYRVLIIFKDTRTDDCLKGKWADICMSWYLSYLGFARVHVPIEDYFSEIYAC